MRQVLSLLGKDIRLDLRNGSGIGALFLYVVAGCFIIFLAFQEITGLEWVVLFWIVNLFSAINAVLRSFTYEGLRRQLYYFTIVEPITALVAKLLYNISLIWITLLLTGVVLALFTGFPIVAFAEFVLVCFLGGIGIATCFTLVSVLAFRARNQSTLTMILAFPVIIPLLLPLIKASKLTLAPLLWVDLQNSIWMLIGVDFILLALIVLLFPFAWKE